MVVPLKDKGGVGLVCESVCVCVEGRVFNMGGGFPLIIHRQRLMRGFFMIGYTSD